jgi:hypothetical protein
MAAPAQGFVGSGVGGSGLRPRVGSLFHRFTTHPTASAVATMGSAPGMGQINAASNRGNTLPSFIACPCCDRTRPAAAFRRLGKFARLLPSKDRKSSGSLCKPIAAWLVEPASYATQRLFRCAALHRRSADPRHHRPTGQYRRWGWVRRDGLWESRETHWRRFCRAQWVRPR